MYFSLEKPAFGSKLTSKLSSLIFEISVVTQVRKKKQYLDMITGNNPDCCHVLVKVFHFLDLFVIYLCQSIMSKGSQSIANSYFNSYTISKDLNCSTNLV